MLKKIKWIILILLSTGIIFLTFIVTLLRYAETEAELLENYRTSLMALPEVASVGDVRRFNGLESYIVANVILETGYEVYYFVFQETVQHFFFASRLISEDEAQTIAERLIRNGEISRTQLGILDEMPIFEVQIQVEDAIHYIVIDAQNGEVIMNFQL